MAKRPAFIPLKYNNKTFVHEQDFSFEWFPGFSTKQKQKSIEAFHKSITKYYPKARVLEVSSKSQNPLGVNLSAFNLMINDKFSSKQFSVESAFQSSKVFENGGPYIDLLEKTSRDAKKDYRLKESGKLKYFKYANHIWKLEPKTAFYDWLYITALMQYKNLVAEVAKYNVFTDIEFNPEQSINCQARSVAILVSLYNNNYLEKTLESIDNFVTIVYNDKANNSKDQKVFEQMSFNDIK